MTSLGKDPNKPPVMAQPEAAAQSAQAQGLEEGTQKDPTAWNTFSEMLNNYLVASGQSGQNISPDTLATLAGSGGAQGNMAGIVSAAQNFAKGYSTVEQQRMTEAAAQDKAVFEERKRVNDVVRPVLDSLKTTEGAQDEKARAEAISNIKKILENPDDFQNINLGDVMKSYFVQAYKPQYKRLAESGDIKDVGSLVAGFFNEGAGKKVGDLISGVEGKGQFGADDAKEILRLLVPLEEQGKKKYEQTLTPYKNLLITQQIENPEQYLETLDWGADSKELIKQYTEMTGGTKEKAQNKAKAQQGTKKVNSAGLEVVFDGTKWVYPDELEAK